MADNHTTAQNSAKAAVFAYSDVSVLGGIVGLLEANNLKTEEAIQAQQELIAICKRGIRRIMVKHDGDMRKVGI